MGAGRVNNAIRIPASLKGSFFRMWIEFLTPLHNLPNRVKDIIAAFLKVRHDLSKSVFDDALLDKLTLSEDVKKQIKKEYNINDAYFQVIMGKLRKAKIIHNGRINPKLIPKKIQEGDKTFQLVLQFDLDAEDN